MVHAGPRWLSRLGDSLKELLWPLGRFCILCGVATRSQSLCPQCLANLRACALPVAHQHPGMTAADGLCAAFPMRMRPSGWCGS